MKTADDHLASCSFTFWCAKGCRCAAFGLVSSENKWRQTVCLIHSQFSLSLSLPLLISWQWVFLVNLSNHVSISQSCHCYQASNLFSCLLLSVVISMQIAATLLHSIHLQSMHPVPRSSSSLRMQSLLIKMIFGWVQTREPDNNQVYCWLVIMLFTEFILSSDSWYDQPPQSVFVILILDGDGQQLLKMRKNFLIWMFCTLPMRQIYWCQESLTLVDLYFSWYRSIKKCLIPGFSSRQDYVTRVVGDRVMLPDLMVPVSYRIVGWGWTFLLFSNVMY